VSLRDVSEFVMEGKNSKEKECINKELSEDWMER
jgi:hypothetical protein